MADNNPVDNTQKALQWGNWKVEARIGQGACGKVYKIRREEDGKTSRSAIKIISIPQRNELQKMVDQGSREEDIRAHFRKQVDNIIRGIDQNIALGENENLVHIEDYQVIDKTTQPHETRTGEPLTLETGWHILIRMELLQNLSEITKTDITNDEVIKMGIQICRALELGIPQKMYHGGVKPSNIFISPEGDYKLGDFGIANQTQKGTNEYMAPEVLRGEQYGTDSDIYSLGILMYSLLNENRLPFLPDAPLPIKPKDGEIALTKRMNGERFPIPKGGTASLNALVLKACAFDREQRFTTPAEMRQALEQCRIEESRRSEAPGSALRIKEPTQVDIPQRAEVTSRDDYPGQLTEPGMAMSQKDPRKPTEMTPDLAAFSGGVLANQQGNNRNLLLAVTLALSVLGILLVSLAIILIVRLPIVSQVNDPFQDTQGQGTTDVSLAEEDQDPSNGDDEDDHPESDNPVIVDAAPNSLSIVTYNGVENGGSTSTRAWRAETGKPVDLTLQATKEGWEFVGWNTNQNATTGLTTYTMPTMNVTLYAIYKKTLTATFHDYGGTTPVSRQVSVTIYNKATSGNIIAPRLNTYTGWTARGWGVSTDKDAGVSILPGNRSINGDTTYYGLYQRTLTLSYDSNGKTCTLPPSRTGTQYVNSYDINTSFNPTFAVGAVRNNTTEFLHWSLDNEDDQEYAPGSIITISAGSKLYAVWEDT
ncbi:MAG: protein kinase [Peptococcaceae bacterium]|nr:protein kinase [Peptococcaceae bacterium]